MSKALQCLSKNQEISEECSSLIFLVIKETIILKLLWIIYTEIAMSQRPALRVL